MTLGIILSGFLGLNKPDFYEEMFASFDTFRMKKCKKNRLLKGLSAMCNERTV